MKKYIDADKLITEIERRIALICTTEGVVQRDKLQEYEILRDIGDFIDSLQQEQPEVDLEKEYSEFVEQDMVYSRLVNGIVGKAIARHFYELGLKARKEE